MKQFSRHAPSLHGINPLRPTSSAPNLPPLTILPILPPPPRDVTPKTPPCKSHLVTPSACPLHLTITGHISLVYLPITTLHIIQVHTSDVLRLPPHALKDPLAIYYWLHTHYSFDLSFLSNGFLFTKFQPYFRHSHSAHTPYAPKTHFPSLLQQFTQP
jgi:hypothetical protein